MKKPKLAGSVIAFLLIGLILPAIFIWAISHGMGVEDEYSERGIPVSCKVCGVTSIGRNQSVRVKYKAESGEWIEADCIANQRVSLSQSLEGYVLPEDPYNVYCPPGAELKVILYAIIGAIAVGGWAVLISALRARSKYNRLMNSGIPCKAELTSWHKEEYGIVGQFRIFTKSGEERIIDITAQHGAPIVGGFYNVLVSEGKGGKITAALIDEDLR